MGYPEVTEQASMLDIHPVPAPTHPTTPPKLLDDLIGDEMHRIEHLHKEEGRFAESRWARYLDVEPVTDDDDEPEPQTPSSDVQWFTTKAEQREITRAK
jgi:hypothetical protein